MIAGRPRVAAIDCGTNSIRLLVADVDGERLTDVVREMRVVRLGQGVDATGRLADEAIARTRDALREYAAQLRALGAERVHMVATSASRDASNAEEFVAMVRAELGQDPEVVSGAEEAALSFTGATRGMGLTGPVLLTDIGGGSTEVVRGSGEGVVQAALSVDVGCVRMTERHLRSDPARASEVAAATADIEAALDRVAQHVPLDGAASFVGVAGSVTTVAAVAAGLSSYDPGVIHGLRVPLEQVQRVTADLLAMTREQRAAIPVMHPGRVDVIGAGALVLRLLMERTGVDEVIASEHDILDGIAWSQV